MIMNKSIGIIILAAGASTRLGQPKQLLIYKGNTLILNTVEIAVNSGCSPIIVVLGAYGNLILPEISNFPVKIVENHDWQEGMNTSIRAGINTLQTTQEIIEAVIIMVCDQPFLSTNLIQKIIDVYYLKSNPIVASKYAGVLGVPALFSSSLFPEMLNLNTDKGAKQIINKYAGQVAIVNFHRGEIDIDTFTDYERLKILSEGSREWGSRGVGE
ncbi:nucleotidyltransferase family protein [Okeania hirsuta]|uniref:Nucleotidyltransferase family protein n=2 Tax=Microcoleaceae TaxID=1892252 RepID=A0A3N6QWF5_9CYAN|nr:nucleotidyltransferase family protein [Okeania sp. SIO2B9]NET78453.1 nucleotidyltransferase family protein [Okeania sp. SIO1F9]RQH21108.1 nucleotidyltransferase family protein [Okeania hirsuta]RQH43740.1 nucleotidyltransferase family protein [Okeania hirsuta]